MKGEHSRFIREGGDRAMTSHAVVHSFKRFARLAVAGLALAGLAACGGGGSSTPADTTPTTPTPAEPTPTPPSEIPITPGGSDVYSCRQIRSNQILSKVCFESNFGANFGCETLPVSRMRCARTGSDVISSCDRGLIEGRGGFGASRGQWRRDFAYGDANATYSVADIERAMRSACAAGDGGTFRILTQ